MNRIGIAQVQQRVKELAGKKYPISIDFKTCWRITIGGEQSPSGLTSTQLSQWLDAVEVGMRVGTIEAIKVLDGAERVKID